jgi:hypothetical protein
MAKIFLKYEPITPPSKIRISPSQEFNKTYISSQVDAAQRLDSTEAVFHYEIGDLVLCAIGCRLGYIIVFSTTFFTTQLSCSEFVSSEN